jgi:ATP/maltotriose-dependent transcriptional regulator MalT
VDSSELELPIFLSYLIASVRLVWPAFGAATLELLDRLTPTNAAEPDAIRYAESLLCDLTEERAQPLLVVIEDLHLVYDADWLIPFFSRLLPLLPPEAHFVVTGRSALPAPLWRMRSKQTLCFIDETELAFTIAEAQLLYRHYGLSPAEASTALAETRGRAAHLHSLLTRALADRGDVPPPARNVTPAALPPRGRRLRSVAELPRDGRTRVRR